MKRISCILVTTLLVLAILAPTALVAQELQRPIQKTVLPGTTIINYAEQRLVFTTDVTLSVGLKMVSWNRIELSFKTLVSRPVGPPGTSSDYEVQIFWDNFSEWVYDGSAPEDEWSGILNTESGYTEK